MDVSTVQASARSGDSLRPQTRVDSIASGSAEAGRLKELLALHQAALESMAHGLCMVDAEQRLTLYNRRFIEIFNLLPEALRKRGAKVDEVVLYETVAETPDPEALESARDADFITFTSSSTVRNFMAASKNGIPEGAKVVSIGPITSEAAREAGLTVDVEAERHDISGLVEALLQVAGD